MKLLVTGTPGCGKTTLAKGLGKELSCVVFNEKDFALQSGIGTFSEDNELEIPLKQIETKANAFLKKNNNIIFEGHVLCETKLQVDRVIVVTINPESLESRLEARNYAPLKVADNVFCEGIEYCKKHVLRKYSRSKVIIVPSQQTPKQTLFLAKTLLNASLQQKRTKRA